MEPNDSNMKPQPTGGLKLMTVFIAVLALHVLVIGGFTLKSWLYPSSPYDVAADKTHKSSKIVADNSITEMNTGTDTASADKPAGAAAAATESEAPAASETPAAATTTATASAAPAAPATPAAVQPAMVISAEDASSTAANPAANGAIRNGPVITPPSNLAPPAEPSASSIAADATATAPAVAAAPDANAYVVKKGDSLAKIAHRHHVTLSNLRAANGLAGDGLHIGQKLTIPAKAAKASTLAVSTAPTVTPTPAVSAPEAPVSTAPVAQPVQEVDMATGSLTGTLPKHTSHKLASAPAAHHSYTVVKGDTLTKIAKRYHTTTNAIMAANNLTNAGRLSIGQKLHIPSHESRAATADGAVPQEQETHTAAHGQLANYTP